MKFRVERDVLADAVAWTARALPLRPSAPVLAGLLIEAGSIDEPPERATASSCPPSTTRPPRGPRSTPTSPRRGARSSPAGCSPTSAAACPTSRSRWPSTGPKVTLTCGSARFSLQTMPVEDYPTLPRCRRHAARVKSELFAHAVAQAVTAAGRDDMLPVLTGVRLEMDGDTISMLATDRFRLSQRELEWEPATPDISAAALVPARVLADTAKSLTGGSEISIALSAVGHRRGDHRLRGLGRRRRPPYHDPAAGR